MPHALLIGASSSIASYFKKSFDKSCLTFTEAGRHSELKVSLDCLDLDSLLLPPGITHAIFFAGITNIQYCEDHPEYSRLVNLTSTLAFIRHLNSQGVPCLFLSSSAVFSNTTRDTSELSLKDPNSIYGILKSQVEDEILDSEFNAVLRIPKVLSKTTPLIDGWFSNLLSGVKIRPFFDLRLSPISFPTVSKFLYDWILCTEEYNRQKILHLSPSADITYHQLALYIANYLGVPHELVAPISVSSLSRPLLFNPSQAFLSVTLPHSRSLNLNDEIKIMLQK